MCECAVSLLDILEALPVCLGIGVHPCPSICFALYPVSHAAKHPERILLKAVTCYLNERIWEASGTEAAWLRVSFVCLCSVSVRCSLQSSVCPQESSLMHQVLGPKVR